MLFGLFVALSLTTAQDSCVIDSNNVYRSAYYVACAGGFDSWEEVLDFRQIANKEGFGSVASLRPDSSYALSFILFGDSSTVQSQWIRLNALIGFKSKLRKPTFGEVKPVAKTDLARVGSTRLTANHNVSVWRNKYALTIRPLQAQKKAVYLWPGDTAATVEPEALSIEDSGPSKDSLKSASQTINSALLGKDSAVSLAPSETMAGMGQSIDSIEFKSVVDTVSAITSQNHSFTRPSEDTNKESAAKKTSIAVAKKTPPDSSQFSKIEVYRNVSEDHERPIFSDKQIEKIKQGTYYLIVFGSYRDRKTAARHRDRLKADGLEAEIKPHKNNFRVVLYFDYPPLKELEKYRRSHPPCWLATINQIKYGSKTL
jgi:hypothetical protein